MTEFEFKKKNWVHPVIIEAESEEKANERFEVLLGKKDDN